VGVSIRFSVLERPQTILELRALTSLVRTGEAQPRVGELLARVAVLLELLTPTHDSADARGARTFASLPQIPGAPRDIPSIKAK